MQGIKTNCIIMVQVVCNNLILKYVEDDMVLSINVRRASLVAADSGWEPAFTELSPTDLVTRKLLSICDLTICLDKRGPMGKIEIYEVGVNVLIVRCISSLLSLGIDNANVPIL